MRRTITTILCGCALIALAAGGVSAQTSYTLAGTCKASFQKVVPAGDQSGHSFGVSQGKCSNNEKIGGATSASGTYAETDDTTATSNKASGIYTTTFNTGDKVFYQYTITLVMKNGAVQSGSGTYMAVGATGKMKGISAKGTCTFGPGATVGTNKYTCTGQYTLAGAM